MARRSASARPSLGSEFMMLKVAVVRRVAASEFAERLPQALDDQSARPVGAVNPSIQTLNRWKPAQGR
jgi:hypothetical protein